jgi:CDP-diacylglycerol--glycerol-3-phosphate 3-phosphatidyltransferase
MKRLLPISLTVLRLLLGPAALYLAAQDGPRLLFIPILLVATLSDIYDGVLARRFGVATPALRRFDSITDVIFYLFIFSSAWILCRSQIHQQITPVLFLVISELLGIGLSLVKFRAYPSTHSYLAKFYGLCLFATFIALLAFNAHGGILLALAIVGTTANIEIISILWLSQTTPVDVASIFLLLKRSKLETTE